jgi:hypothetical protein
VTELTPEVLARVKAEPEPYASTEAPCPNCLMCHEKWPCSTRVRIAILEALQAVGAA